VTQKKERIKVVSAAIVRDGRYLITQRNEHAVLPLLWEFPGGRVEPDESDRDALKRELSYRLGVDADVADEISQVEREYEHYVVELHLYECHIGDAVPLAKTVRDLCWVTSAEFDQFDFTPADEQSMHALLFENEHH
jgi:8-oxo-dGTP diphosphatase